MGPEENEPQINADERGFVASNPAHLIGLWDLVPLLFLSFSCVVACQCIGAWNFIGLVLYFPKTAALNLRLSAFICG
ncbi:MAG TPA: hypothetical protein VIO11_09680 [Candidatus Methanoperedens sp.]